MKAILKAIIVDDEPDALNTLRILIQKHCPEIEILGVASSVEEALVKIEKLRPNLLFLDVELPDGTGFDILRRTQPITFDTIFVSAHNHYSLKAFKFSAIDYLLKPIDIEELCNAVKKVNNLCERYTESYHRDYSILFENLSTSLPKKFVLPSSEGFEFISVDDVVLIKAEGSYSELLFSNGKRKLVAKLLKDFQDRLFDHGFFRSHNSFLINLKHVKKFLRKDGGCIEMCDGSIAALSKKNTEIFKKIMEQHININ
jgi:two-component system LytT family response regulator